MARFKVISRELFFFLFYLVNYLLDVESRLGLNSCLELVGLSFKLLLRFSYLSVLSVKSITVFLFKVHSDLVINE